MPQKQWIKLPWSSCCMLLQNAVTLSNCQCGRGQERVDYNFKFSSFQCNIQLKSGIFSVLRLFQIWKPEWFWMESTKPIVQGRGRNHILLKKFLPPLENTEIAIALMCCIISHPLKKFSSPPTFLEAISHSVPCLATGLKMPTFNYELARD